MATSLITKKLFNSYTLLPSSVSCVQVLNRKRAELSDFDEKKLLILVKHMVSVRIRKHTALFKAYSARCSTVSTAVINSRKQGIQNSSDEAQSILKD